MYLHIIDGYGPLVRKFVNPYPFCMFHKPMKLWKHYEMMLRVSKLCELIMEISEDPHQYMTTHQKRYVRQKILNNFYNSKWHSIYYLLFIRYYEF